MVVDGLPGVDVDDLVVDGGVEDLRDEVGADALDLVRAGRSTVEDRRLGRLDGDDLDTRLAGLEHLADSGDRATGADARDDDVDPTIGVGPDLLGRRAAVGLGVRGVGELAGGMLAGTIGALFLLPAFLLGFRHGRMVAVAIGTLADDHIRLGETGRVGQQSVHVSAHITAERDVARAFGGFDRQMNACTTQNVPCIGKGEFHARQNFERLVIVNALDKP